MDNTEKLKKLKQDILNAKQEYELFLDEHTVENTLEEDTDFQGLPFSHLYSKDITTRTIAYNKLEDYEKQEKLISNYNKRLEIYHKTLIRQMKLNNILKDE